MSLVVLGDLMVDVVARASGPLARGGDTPARVTMAGGGSGANVAAWAASLGAQVAFACRIGEDDRGRLAVDELRAAGVTVHAGRDHDRPTGTCVVLVEPDGERTMFSDRSAAADLTSADPHWLDGATAVHVSYYAIADSADGGARQLLDHARAQQLIISLDPSTSVLADDAFAQLVRTTEPDVVFCNADEAEALGVDDAGLPGARLVVVKQGAHPVLINGATRAAIDVPPVSDAIDTTGAGDAFAGGFLLAYASDASPVEAAHAGLRAAACVVRGPGADAWVER
jgi:sugar/nucleoside kinase (ribokinase family)